MTLEEAKHRILNTAWLGTNEDRESTEEAVKTIFEALEQKNCEDVISRQAVIERLKREEKILYTGTGMNYLIRVIKELPSVSTEKTGYWILLDECANNGYYCSECHKKVVKEGWSETVKKIKFCPNCGAKMQEEDKKQEEKETKYPPNCTVIKTVDTDGNEEIVIMEEGVEE